MSLQYKALFILFLVLQTTMTNAQGQFPPNTDKPQGDLAQFLKEYRAAIAAKNSDFIYNSLDEQIMNSFGGNGGIPEFKEYWQDLNPDSEFWAIMEQILVLGGTYSENKMAFTVPYVYTNWPGHEEFDVFEHLAVTGTKVNLRDKPSLLGSEVLAQLSYAIVKMDYDKTYADIQKPSWIFITDTKTGLSGYMHKDFLYSPVDYRASFVKAADGWKLIFLVAGD